MSRWFSLKVYVAEWQSFGKELLIQSNVCSSCYVVCAALVIFHFISRVLIASVPGYCLHFTFSYGCRIIQRDHLNAKIVSLK